MSDIKRKILTTTQPIRFIVREPCEFVVQCRLLPHRHTIRHVIEAPLCVTIVHPSAMMKPVDSITGSHDGAVPLAESESDRVGPRPRETMV